MRLVLRCVIFFDKTPILGKIGLPIVACRFMHIFIVDCRFAVLVVDVDFGQKTIVDCRQKGPKTCDLHLIRTPPHPPCIVFKKTTKIILKFQNHSFPHSGIFLFKSEVHPKKNHSGG